MATKKQSAYYEKLKDPRWQKKRLEIFERDEWFCRKCGSNEETLTVHHTVYRPGTEPWDYDLSELITLCADCHEYEYTQGRVSEQEFLATLRKKLFFADDLIDLNKAFEELRFHGPGEYMASFIRWLFSNHEVMSVLDDKYGEWVKEEIKKRKADEITEH